jgi:hypothetical protein
MILVFCKINARVHLRLELSYTKKKIRLFCFVSQLYLKILGMSKNAREKHDRSWSAEFIRKCIY